MRFYFNVSIKPSFAEWRFIKNASDANSSLFLPDKRHHASVATVSFDTINFFIIAFKGFAAGNEVFTNGLRVLSFASFVFFVFFFISYFCVAGRARGDCVWELANIYLYTRYSLFLRLHPSWLPWKCRSEFNKLKKANENSSRLSYSSDQWNKLYPVRSDNLSLCPVCDPMAVFSDLWPV